jgi:DNA-directed RNA polymerase specialized sigma24 family protein
MDGLPDEVNTVIRCLSRTLSTQPPFHGQAQDLAQDFALYYLRHRHKFDSTRSSLSTFTAKLIRTRAYTLRRTLLWPKRDRRREILMAFNPGNGAETFSYNDPIELRLILKEQGYAIEEG